MSGRHSAHPAGHVVLLGDSVFDNQAYIGGGPDVVAQLREELGPGWRATLLAVDGDTTSGIARQLGRLPHDATHLAVSVGGNDALAFAYLLDEPAGSVSSALDMLADARDPFAATYGEMVDALCARKLPLAVCTIYDTRPSEPRQRTVRTAASLFNDAITRAAFSRGISLLDLRLICSEDADYANPIEPSAQGGRKIARAIAALVTDDGAAPRSTVIGA